MSMVTDHGESGRVAVSSGGVIQRPTLCGRCGRGQEEERVVGGVSGSPGPPAGPRWGPAAGPRKEGAIAWPAPNRWEGPSIWARATGRMVAYVRTPESPTQRDGSTWSHCAGRSTRSATSRGACEEPARGPKQPDGPPWSVRGRLRQPRPSGPAAYNMVGGGTSSFKGNILGVAGR
jgi:hypothetical protein